MLHVSENSRFNFCLDTYVIRDPECFGHSVSCGANLIKKLHIAKQAGYSAVELWHKDVEKYVAEVGSLESLRKHIESIGLILPSYKVVETWNQITPLKTAAEIGAQSCVVKIVHDDYTGTKPSLYEMTKKYELLLNESDKLNIRPSLEFMSLAKYYNTLEETCDILDAVDHPKASLVLDTWHIWRSSSLENCLLERVKPEWISVIHYTDARKDVPKYNQRDGDRKMPGEGVMDLTSFCNRLNSMNRKIWLSLNVYDKTLWHEDPLRVASRGLFAMKRTSENIPNLIDSDQWSRSQKNRCYGLWAKSYNTHLDPRIEKSNRSEKLLQILYDYIDGKTVLDFKCGFSPLAEMITYGFDAFQGCIDYLKMNFPKGHWYCESDIHFANRFNKKIDVLLHIGIGDSMTEIESHLQIRNKCFPELIVIEAAADDNGQVDESKIGNRANWERLKDGLSGETYLFDTNMQERSKRIMFVGKITTSS